MTSDELDLMEKLCEAAVDVSWQGEVHLSDQKQRNKDLVAGIERTLQHMWSNRWDMAELELTTTLMEAGYECPTNPFPSQDD